MAGEPPEIRIVNPEPQAVRLVAEYRIRSWADRIRVLLGCSLRQEVTFMVWRDQQGESHVDAPQTPDLHVDRFFAPVQPALPAPQQA